MKLPVDKVRGSDGINSSEWEHQSQAASCRLKPFVFDTTHGPIHGCTRERHCVNVEHQVAGPLFMFLISSKHQTELRYVIVVVVSIEENR